MHGLAEVEDAPRLATALHALSATLLTADSSEAMLQRTAEIAARTVPDGAGAGVTLTRYGGAPMTVSASEPGVLAVEEIQYTAGRGPAIEALAGGCAVDVPDGGMGECWPEFAHAAATAGIGSSHCEPLRVEARTVGVLSLYSAHPFAFGEEESRSARLVADHLEVLLTSRLRLAGQARIAEQLEQALRSRATIDQAIGIVMAQQECAPDQAFALLRELSNRTNTRLREVAARIVNRVSRRVIEKKAAGRTGNAGEP
jgi:GAF domain-containing protein